jgi:hypothetical protein
MAQKKSVHRERRREEAGLEIPQLETAEAVLERSNVEGHQRTDKDAGREVSVNRDKRTHDELSLTPIPPPSLLSSLYGHSPIGHFRAADD